MIEKLYTVEEVAEMASVTGRTIRNYLKSGKLVGRKIGGQWRFPESEVQRLLTGESTEEYSPQNISADFGAEPTPQNFDTGTFPRVEPNYTPTTNSPQSSSLGNIQNYSTLPENNTAQNANNFAGNTQPQPYTQQPYATGTFPAQNPEAQPAPHSAVQSNYANSTNTTSAPQNTPNLSQQNYSVPQQNTTAQNYTSTPAHTASTQSSFTAQPSYQQPVQPIQTVQPIQPTQQFEQSRPQNNFSQSTSYQYNPQVPIEPLYDVSAQEVSPTQTASNYKAPAATVPEISELLNAYVEQVTNSSASKNYQSSASATKEPAAKEPISKAKDEPDSEESDTISFKDLSDVGKQVGKFLGEVHDCSNGPQICAVIDLYQSLEAAKVTSQHITEMAEIESENGIPCDCFVEFDSRYYVARYTLFGSSYYLSQCLDLIG